MQTLNALGSQDQERELEEVLERLKTQVRTRRLMLYPYFRDFDRVSAQSQKLNRSKPHVAGFGEIFVQQKKFLISGMYYS